LKHFTASDGARIAYEDEGQGRPLVMLHGLMAHSGFFVKQRALASDFRLIGIDLRGHGRSVADGRAPTVEQLANDVSAIAETLELEQAIIVGWSLGAPVLWHVLSGSAAERFAGAVVVDMTPRVLNDGEWQLGLSEEMCEARRNAIRDDFASFAIGAGQAMFAQPVREEHRGLAEWAGEEFARNDPAAIDALWSSLVEQDFRPVLGRIRQPTLVIHGAHSQLYGSDTAKHLVSALPSARAVQFDKSGHAPQLEQPDLFNATIRDFAASLPRVRETKVTACTGETSWPLEPPSSKH
jgi:pimeloyl-[acyl-carrier protein] methyl ester esterase